jgi:murein peptide amidase A
MFSESICDLTASQHYGLTQRNRRHDQEPDDVIREPRRRAECRFQSGTGEDNEPIRQDHLPVETNIPGSSGDASGMTTASTLAIVRVRGLLCGCVLAVVAAVGCWNSASAAGGRHIGRSVRGRPILAFHLGEPGGLAVLVVGSVDGDEPAGIAIVEALRRLRPPRGLDLWLIPSINPDGVAATTRGNVDGVDLNRNFPYAWQPLGGSSYSGPRPLSEPESRAVYRFLLRIRPRLSIWFHQPLALVDDSQGVRPLERDFARLVGLPVRPLVDYPGSITNWENHQFAGSTAFVTELPPGPLRPAQSARYARAVLAVAERLAR